jgi:Fe-S cluster biogenesis protein NfuA
MLSRERLTQQFQDAIQPMIADGGGARLTAFDPAEGSVRIEMIGTCLYCPNLIRSAGALIERLVARLPELGAIRVEVRGEVLASWRQGGAPELKSLIQSPSIDRAAMIHPSNRARLSVLKVA